MKIETWKLEDIIPYEQNAKLHNIEWIKHSLSEFKIDQPIVVDGDGVIIKGHGRLKAAQELGLTEFPVVVRTDLTPEQVRLARIADNRSGDGGWDIDNLLAELGDLNFDDFGVGADGFGITQEWLKELGSDVDLDSILNGGDGKEEHGDPDDIPDVDEEKEPLTRYGDMWACGEHRLSCGDSTKSEDVARLMGGEKADMVFTDPPYGVDYDGGTTKRRKLKGDDTTVLYAPTCKMAYQYSTENSSLYLWHANMKGFASAAASAAASAGWEIRNEIIWNKNLAQFGALSAQYKQKHEPAFYCFKHGKIVNWNGPTNEVTVWDVDRSSVNDLPPTQKPVALATRAINNHSCSSVIDFFGGSGSTLIACEMTERKCFMMELDPKYCDVILTRYMAYTGRDDVFLMQDDQRIPYADVVNERT